jgi:hypothetical protein
MEDLSWSLMAVGEKIRRRHLYGRMVNGVVSGLLGEDPSLSLLRVAVGRRGGLYGL